MCPSGHASLRLERQHQGSARALVVVTIVLAAMAVLYWYVSWVRSRDTWVCTSSDDQASCFVTHLAPVGPQGQLSVCGPTDIDLSSPPVASGHPHLLAQRSRLASTLVDLCGGSSPTETDTAVWYASNRSYWRRPPNTRSSWRQAPSRLPPTSYCLLLSLGDTGGMSQNSGTGAAAEKSRPVTGTLTHPHWPTLSLRQHESTLPSDTTIRAEASNLILSDCLYFVPNTFGTKAKSHACTAYLAGEYTPCCLVTE